MDAGRIAAAHSLPVARLYLVGNIVVAAVLFGRRVGHLCALALILTA